jgi:signal transduction histidine kinase/ActR/RegA family two-component response regulator
VLSRDLELAELYRKTGLVSAMAVPISGRERNLGVIVFVSATAGKNYDKEDLAMAEELGRRAGISIDNARLYRQAQQAVRLKDEFLAMLGHELRNPLAPILTALEVMNLRGGEAFTNERMIIARQVQHMVRLVDDLLDVSRVTRGKVQLKKQSVEMSQVITKALEMASPLLEERLQKLALAIPSQGLPVIADAERLSQAIANLLTNAAKYTEPWGKISITAAAEGRDVVIRVNDTGIGIAPDVLPHVFDLFVQAPASLDRAQGGLGIGLTVVRSIVELHGGTVSAKSPGLGKGSEFAVRLPLAPEPTTSLPGPSEPPLTAVSPSARRSRVLVVDDNLDAAEMLSLALEMLGCETHLASDGPSALATAFATRPELALVDLGLPVMDGYELARRLRHSEATRGIRLVAITGYGQASDRAQSLKAGFDEHFVKPVALDLIREILERLEVHPDRTSKE